MSPPAAPLRRQAAVACRNLVGASLVLLFAAWALFAVWLHQWSGYRAGWVDHGEAAATVQSSYMLVWEALGTFFAGDAGGFGSVSLYRLVPVGGQELRTLCTQC